MSELLPPSIDPIAAARWASLAASAERAPWLHEEVARRMAERLQIIRLPVTRWAHWEPRRGGLQGHALVSRHYPGAKAFLVQAAADQGVGQQEAAARPAVRSWLERIGFGRSALQSGVVPPEGDMQMVWANMLIHQVADPAALLAQWHRSLATDGFVMFSCLGPDTLSELRALYAHLGWPPPTHEFTDMHDWGDLLVAAGFSEPVMDMERITLTFESPSRLLEELRGLGRNLNLRRFQGLRGRAWLERLEDFMQERMRLTQGGAQGEPGPLALSFEVIYGHAIKPAPRARVAPRTEIPLDDMKAALRERKKP